MKNQTTLGLFLGTTCLATIAMTQVSKPGDAPAQDRKPAVAGQENADSLANVQQRLQQAVTSELRTGAMQHDVTIDEAGVMISLVANHGMVAGAPAKQGTAVDSGRKPGDPAPTTGTGREPAGAPQGAASQDVVGVVVLSRGLTPASGATLPGAAGGAAGQPAPPSNAATGGNELAAFEVRRSQQGHQVELVDQTGRVALQVQLLNASGRTREASAPREDREDATVGAGDPLGDPRAQDPQGKNPPAKDPQGKDRPVAGGEMDELHAGSADWSVVYASIVHQLCRKHHGKL